ncbi:Transmembrane protein 42 [Coemansia sp. RSA 1972]|nr:Transmembrane protein 42 [Coemansia sp. RSA 1972]
MPEIQIDRFAQQFPNKYNPPSYAYVPAPSTFFAILGGTFAALSTVTAKLTVSSPPLYLQQLTTALHATHSTHIIRILMISATIVCNVFMWLFFTKALRFGDSTPRVMMMQTAANFAVTAACGVYVFGDALSVQWWAGASLIGAGLVALNVERPEFECEGADHAMGIDEESKKSK